jgi:transglutaminase-like putative cysteine protease
VVTYKISGENLPTIPSDAYQSATKNPDGSIILKVNPTFPDPKSSKTLGEVGVNAQTYLKPSMHIPSDQKRFKDLAKQIVGTETNAAKAMRLISVWVGEKIGVNAGIGVLRDANEVLDSKEGVCRDNAILAATLLRASGIPTKVISGLIYDQQAMYYHAWNECWDGKRWVLIDSTRPRTDQNALRIKLGQGNVEEAFLFTVLTRAKVEVLNVKYRS